MSTPGSPQWVRSLERVRELIEQAKAAAYAEDWTTAIGAAHEAVKQATEARKAVVNQARLIGKMSGEAVGRLLTTDKKPEGITSEAVIQQFGPLRAIASDAGRAQWEAERQQDDVI